MKVTHWGFMLSWMTTTQTVFAFVIRPLLPSSALTRSRSESCTRYSYFKSQAANNQRSNGDETYHHHHHPKRRKGSKRRPRKQVKFYQSEENKKSRQKRILRNYEPFVYRYKIPGLEPMNAKNDTNNNLTGTRPLEVVYTNDSRAIIAWIEKYVYYRSSVGNNRKSFIGFDLESIPDVPWIDKPAEPAVMQLSTLDSCLLVHLSHVPRPLPRLLYDLISDKNIIKIGVGIECDFIELYRWDKKFKAKSRFDLSSLARRDANDGGGTFGLKCMAAIVLGCDLPKNKKISRSDWSNYPLSHTQITYSARDAWVSRAVMAEFEEFSKSSCCCCSSSSNNSSDKEERLSADSTFEYLQHHEQPIKKVNYRASVRKNAKSALKLLIQKYQEVPKSSLEEETSFLCEIIDQTRPYQAPALSNINIFKMNSSAATS